MIVIPRYLKKKKTQHAHTYYHYELIEDKCTDKLAVYRCIENGCIETWQKKCFKDKNAAKDKGSKYEWEDFL